MTDHTLFILRFILFAAIHSLFATGRVKLSISRVFSGAPRLYRICYNLAALIMFGWVMAADRHSAVIYYVPGIWSLVMYLLQLMAASVLLLCIRQTGTAEFIGLSQWRSGSKQRNSLTTTGCYALTRHPLYLFAVIFLVLNPVMTTQWLLLTLLSCVYFTLGAMLEERRLLAEFGEVYRRYQQMAPFLFPALKRQKPSGA